MHNALPVRVGQRAADLGEHTRSGLDLPRPALQRLPQRTAAQPAHHQVGALRVAPVVIERDDVRVLELGDELRLGLEAADEGGLVDQLRTDDLDRHLAAHRRLIGAVDDAEVAGAHLLAQLVAADGAPEASARRRRRRPVDSKRREVGRQPLDDQLEHSDRRADPLEAVLAQCLRLPAGTGRREAVRVPGEQHLAAVRRGEQAPRSVEHGAKVVPAPPLHLARVDRHPNAERARLAPVDLRELDLDRLRGGDGGGGVGESDVDAVADPLDDLPGGRLHGTQHDPVVLGHRSPHRVRVQLPEHGRVLDVRQQEGPRLDLRLCVGQQRAVLVQDQALQLLELPARLEAELVGQVGARLPVGPQSLGLPAGAVEREHVLRAEALAHRVLLAQHFQFGDELRVAAEP